MKYFKRIVIFLTMDFLSKKMLVEAYFYLAWSRLLKTMPFAKLSSQLGDYMGETPLKNDPAQIKTLKDISNAVHIMSRYTFWESECMVKAIAAMKMLDRRHIESTIYFGTAKDADGRLIAHAWLRSGAVYLTGANEMGKFTVVSRFSKPMTEEIEGFSHASNR